MSFNAPLSSTVVKRSQAEASDCVVKDAAYWVSESGPVEEGEEKIR